MKVSVFVLGCITGLAGCVTGHVPVPNGVPAAHVRFASLGGEGGVNIHVALFESEACDGQTNVAALGGIGINHSRTDLGMPLGEEFSEKVKTEIPVRADKPLTYTMGFQIGGVYSTGYSCAVGATFEPKENRFYEATFALVGNRCITRVHEIIKSGSGRYIRISEQSVRQTTRTCKL